MSTNSSYGKAETRDRILDAAWRLIEERGARVRMTDIATAAGVSRQALYLHFENRVGLLIGLIDHINRAVQLGELLRPVREAPTGRVALVRMIGVHAAYHEQVVGVARILDAARHHDPEVAAAWNDRMSKRLEDHRRIVQRIESEGDLRPQWDIESASRFFYTITHFWVWDELTTQQGWSVTECQEHLTDTLTRTLLTDS